MSATTLFCKPGSHIQLRRFGLDVGVVLLREVFYREVAPTRPSSQVRFQVR